MSWQNYLAKNKVIASNQLNFFVVVTLVFFIQKNVPYSWCTFSFNAVIFQDFLQNHFIKNKNGGNKFIRDCPRLLTSSNRKNDFKVKQKVLLRLLKITLTLNQNEDGLRYSTARPLGLVGMPRRWSNDPFVIWEHPYLSPIY